MLTPGPLNETYFEHAYLSRYLGFTLVEGQGLTVRQDRVYLKTLQGLKRVHVVCGGKMTLFAIRWNCARIRLWVFPVWRGHNGADKC